MRPTTLDSPQLPIDIESFVLTQSSTTHSSTTLEQCSALTVPGSTHRFPSEEGAGWRVPSPVSRNSGYCYAGVQIFVTQETEEIPSLTREINAVMVVPAFNVRGTATCFLCSGSYFSVERLKIVALWHHLALLNARKRMWMLFHDIYDIYDKHCTAVQHNPAP
jgi:hypothetical protein